jgi:hypothetical protein
MASETKPSAAYRRAALWFIIAWFTISVSQWMNAKNAVCKK